MGAPIEYSFYRWCIKRSGKDHSRGAIAIITVRCGNSAATKGIDRSSLPVYQQSWWIEIARGSSRYVEAQVLEDGVVVGSFPYIERKNALGITWGISPHWTHLGGPVVSQALSDERKAEVLRQLMAQLTPKSPFIFNFVCNPNAHDADLVRRAFINAGFNHFKQVTYSQPPQDAGVMSRLNGKHRSHINSADRALEVVEIGADEFTDFYEANLKAADLVSWSPLDVAHNLIVKGQQGHAPQVRVIAARKKRKELPYDAAIACAWDKERYYLWMMTRRRPFDDGSDDKPHPDAMKLLIVKAMQHAQYLGLTFDVDGYASQGTKKFYTEILKIPDMEFRDAFERATGLARLFIVYRMKIKKVAAFLGFRKYIS
jgi:hypothetical protein